MSSNYIISAVSTANSGGIGSDGGEEEYENTITMIISEKVFYYVLDRILQEDFLNFDRQYVDTYYYSDATTVPNVGENEGVIGEKEQTLRVRIYGKMNDYNSNARGIIEPPKEIDCFSIKCDENIFLERKVCHHKSTRLHYTDIQILSPETQRPLVSDDDEGRKILFMPVITSHCTETDLTDSLVFSHNSSSPNTTTITNNNGCGGGDINVSKKIPIPATHHDYTADVGTATRDLDRVNDDIMNNITEIKQGYATYMRFGPGGARTVRMILGRRSLRQGIFSAKSNTENYKYLTFEEEYNSFESAVEQASSFFKFVVSIFSPIEWCNIILSKDIFSSSNNDSNFNNDYDDLDNDDDIFGGCSLDVYKFLNFPFSFVSSKKEFIRKSTQQASFLSTEMLEDTSTPTASKRRRYDNDEEIFIIDFDNYNDESSQSSSTSQLSSHLQSPPPTTTTNPIIVTPKWDGETFKGIIENGGKSLTILTSKGIKTFRLLLLSLPFIQPVVVSGEAIDWNESEGFYRRFIITEFLAYPYMAPKRIRSGSFIPKTTSIVKKPESSSSKTRYRDCYSNRTKIFGDIEITKYYNEQCQRRRRRPTSVVVGSTKNSKVLFYNGYRNVIDNNTNTSGSNISNNNNLSLYSFGGNFDNEGFCYGKRWNYIKIDFLMSSQLINTMRNKEFIIDKEHGVVLSFTKHVYTDLDHIKKLTLNKLYLVYNNNAADGRYNRLDLISSTSQQPHPPTTIVDTFTTSSSTWSSDFLEKYSDGFLLINPRLEIIYKMKTHYTLDLSFVEEQFSFARDKRKSRLYTSDGVCIIPNDVIMEKNTIIEFTNNVLDITDNVYEFALTKPDEGDFVLVRRRLEKMNTINKWKTCKQLLVACGYDFIEVSNNLPSAFSYTTSPPSTTSLESLTATSSSSLSSGKKPVDDNTITPSSSSPSTTTTTSTTRNHCPIENNNIVVYLIKRSPSSSSSSPPPPSLPTTATSLN